MNLVPQFLSHDGELAALMRARDWAATPLGPAPGWPDALKYALRLILSSKQAMLIWWGPDALQFHNDAFRAAVGSQCTSDMLGRPGRESWGARWSAMGPGVEAIMAGGPSTVHENQNAPESLCGNYSYSPIHDDGGVGGVLVVCTDVSAEKRALDASELHLAREDLEVSRARFGEAMVAGRMAIWDWDIASERIIFSQNTAEVFGGTWSSIADVWNSVCEDDVERLTLAGEAAEKVCGSYEEVVRIKRAGFDDPLWLQIHGKFIADDAGVARTVRSVAIDVTGLKYAQKALQEADARKDEFLAMLAHELRNPLAPIRSAAQLLDIVHGDGEQVKRMGAIIARQADHMASLINDLVDVSRVTSGLVTLDKRAHDIWSIVAEAVEQVMPMMQERFHRLAVDPPGPAAMVMGDRKRLVQVVTNLLDNAAKYTPAKGHIQVEVRHAGGRVTVVVRDNGVGMSAELLPHVFELFSQATRSSDRSQGGLGLGLALVQRLVRLHGGRVLAESAGPGLGAAFTVTLPALDGAGAMQAAAPASVGRGKAPLRVMVVDDNADAANILGIWLETFGHHVRIEFSAMAVLEQAATSYYDVYLLDIGLPGMDGNELARCLRQFPHNADATIIANTGYGGAYDKAEATAAGFDHYFVKPVNLGQLERVLAGITHRAAPLLAA